MKNLVFPQDLVKLLSRRYSQRAFEWLMAAYCNNQGSSVRLPSDDIVESRSSTTGATFKVGLGQITESDFVREPDLCRRWVETWLLWQPESQVNWQLKNWRSKGFGAQTIPVSVSFAGPEDIADLLGCRSSWERAKYRLLALLDSWPELSQLSSLRAILFDYEDGDYDCLIKFAKWIIQNPRSNSYLRQVPIGGIDTKWLESHKSDLSQLLIAAGFVGDTGAGLLSFLGLKSAPELVRVRILDQTVRDMFHGLSDVSIPVSELFALSINFESVFYVENLQSFLSFSDLPGALVVWSGGYGLKGISAQFLRDAKSFYWGDIDTHGLAILQQARKLRPDIHSVLMDKETLLYFKDQWVFEDKQSSAFEPESLTFEESQLFKALLDQEFGVNVRLEQERIEWSYAWSRILEVLKK